MKETTIFDLPKDVLLLIYRYTILANLNNKDTTTLKHQLDMCINLVNNESFCSYKLVDCSYPDCYHFCVKIKDNDDHYDTYSYSNKYTFFGKKCETEPHAFNLNCLKSTQNEVHKIYKETGRICNYCKKWYCWVHTICYCEIPHNLHQITL